jgi:hypothetical protein
MGWGWGYAGVIQDRDWGCWPLVGVPSCSVGVASGLARGFLRSPKSFAQIYANLRNRFCVQNLLRKFLLF